MKFLKYYLLIGVSVLTILSLVFFMYPEYRHHLLDEDDWLENATVIVYLISAAFSLTGLLFIKNRSRHLLAASLLLSLFGALEEMSYGERVFNITAPRVYDYKMDTLHDFYFLFFKTMKVQYENHGIIVLIVSCILGALGLYILFLLWKKYSSWLFQLTKQPPFFYLMIFVLLGFTSLSLDLGLIKHEYLKLLEESIEIMASIALLFAAILALTIKVEKNE